MQDIQVQVEQHILQNQLRLYEVRSVLNIFENVK